MNIVIFFHKDFVTNILVTMETLPVNQTENTIGAMVDPVQETGRVHGISR